MEAKMDLKIQSACLFGDSIAKGVALDDLSGKYTLLKNNFASLAADYLGVLLNNKAKFGCTIKKGQEVISKMIQPVSGIKPFDYAFLEFGGNDCDFNWKEISMDSRAEHLPKTPLPEFVSTYEKIVGDLKASGVTPVIMTMPPLVAESYYNWFCRDIVQKENILIWLGGDTEAIYYWHERYNSAVWEVATKTNSHVIDIRKVFLEQKNYKQYLCTDGIHLNQAGHDMVYHVLIDSINEYSGKAV